MTRQDANSGSTRMLVQWFVHVAVIVLIAGQAVPGINESHYIPKAKSALDPSFAPGDVFLESNNSHFASTYFAGVLAKIMPLTGVAWTGRLLAWGFLSIAWMRFAKAARLSPIVSPFALASWYLATEYGHWAGEWAIGGFEGKSLAYPCVLLALSYCITDRFSRAWVWLGVAVLWHPLVGGWAGLSIGLVWLCGSWRTPISSLRAEMPALMIAAAISAVGVVPALSGIGGSAQLGNIVASQVHVYFRLSHHLCPLAFDVERHWAAAFSLGVFLFVNIAWLVFRFASKASSASSSAPDEEMSTSRDAAGIGRLLLVAWFSIVFAVVGLAVDALMSVPDSAFYNPLTASKILRFYWFRWADIAVPLATVTILWHMLGLVGGIFARSDDATRLDTSRGFAPVSGRILVGVGMAVVTIFGGVRVWQGWNDTLPPADRMLVDNVGLRRTIHSPEESSSRFRDWLAVCNWIRQETPTDSLWLTPRYQQSFKWYANRAEVVCWKDVPQDNASVLEWFTRIQILEPKRDNQGRIRFWTDGELAELAREYEFDYVLADRTYIAQGEIPMQEIVYPIAPVENRTFAVFRVRRWGQD